MAEATGVGSSVSTRPDPAGPPEASLLDRLLGPWRLTGRMGAQELVQDVVGSSELGGRYLRLDVVQSARTVAADRTRYEALYLIGYDAETGGYDFHLFDTFGSAYSGTVGVGRRVGHTIAFVFDYPNGRLANRFTWSPADETWAMELVDVTPTGAETTFASKRLRRPGR